MRSLIVLIISVFITENSFSQWVTQNSNTNATLNAAFFLNNQLGWIACDDGNILRTTDGGANWALHTLSPGSSITDICFVSEQIGFATVGSKIYKSTNSGLSWGEISNYSGNGLGLIYFMNNTLGFILEYPKKILKTTDSGISWREIIVDSNYNFNKVFFKNETTGWASVAEGTNYNGSIFKTTDGGETWEKIYLSSDRLFNISGFSNSDTLFCIGSTFVHLPASGSLYTSLDGGESWSKITAPVNPLILYFSSPTVGRILGGFGMSIFNQKIVLTNDGGTNWMTEDSTTDGLIRNWFFTNNNIGWAVGSYGQLKHFNNPTSIQDKTVLHMAFELWQNYPNPFNPTTTFEFSLSDANYARLNIIDYLGREIVTLISGNLSSGKHQIKWDADNYSSGVYYYRLTVGNKSEIKKLVLLR